MNENEVLDKAVSILNDALDGKVINPVSLNTANSMTFMFWAEVYREKLKQREITESVRHKWDETIQENDK